MEESDTGRNIDCEKKKTEGENKASARSQDKAPTPSLNLREGHDLSRPKGWTCEEAKLEVVTLVPVSLMTPILLPRCKRARLSPKPKTKTETA